MSRWLVFLVTAVVFAVGGWVLLGDRSTGRAGEASLGSPGDNPEPATPGGTSPQASRPNILIIMPDDVGYWNVGAYSHGMMVPTPNIDRIAKEGMLFTDHYAQPTCTPGRADLITGQLPIRTVLTTVGMAGSPIGLDNRDPTLAEV